MEHKIKRNRIIYFVILIIVMLLGIGSRKFGEYLPKFIVLYAGDVLWAMMVYVGFAFIFNKVTYKKITIMAFIFSYAIEFSQLYQASWINSIRATTIGALVLGHGFLFTDLICYSLGIGIALAIEKFIIK